MPFLGNLACHFVGVDRELGPRSGFYDHRMIEHPEREQSSDSQPASSRATLHLSGQWLARCRFFYNFFSHVFFTSILTHQWIDFATAINYGHLLVHMAALTLTGSRSVHDKRQQVRHNRHDAIPYTFNISRGLAWFCFRTCLLMQGFQSRCEQAKNKTKNKIKNNQVCRKVRSLFTGIHWF